MHRAATITINTGLIGLGLLTMAISARPLAKHKSLDFPVNPLGIFRSPYGEVAAMAMQTSIDTLWHLNALAHHSSSSENTTAPHPCPSGTACNHPECSPHHSPLNQSANLPLNHRLRLFLENLEQASTARTNRLHPSPKHDFYIRRQIENKLRFAYRLDPSHYGNYNSYHFFLTKPAVGTRPTLTPEAAQLAHETIQYCLSESSDPRPSLTAAAAATNVLHLMFADQKTDNPTFTPAQMRECLNILDHSIALHLNLRQAWEQSGLSSLISSLRIVEMEDRLFFIQRIRNAAEPAVVRFEQEIDP